MWNTSRAALALGMALAGSLAAQANLRAELESGDKRRIAAARQQVLELFKSEQVDFLRDAIWSENPQAAVWSANRLMYDQVDLREAARVVDLLLPELARRSVLGNEELDFDNLRQLLGSSELPRLLQSFPRTGESPTPGVIITQIHRQIRPAHIPALCKLAMDPSPRVAEPALDYLLGAIVPRTNQHRENIGLTLLHRIKVEVPDTERGGQREGYPPVLARCLENFDRFTTLGKKRFEAQAWMWRWARDEKAGPQDREILLKLLNSDNEQAWSIAAHGLGDFVDEVSQKKLAARRETAKDFNLKCAISSALTRRRQLRHGFVAKTAPDQRISGIVARQAAQADAFLWEWSETRAVALGLYWQSHPRKGRSRFRELLFDADPDRRNVALELCTGDVCEFALAGLQVRREWFEGLGDELPDTGLSGLHLARMVMHVPGLRRVDLAKEAVAQADLKKPQGPRSELEDFLAFLEVTASNHLRTLLATWATSGNQDLCNHARKLQLKVGDETAVNELIAVLEKQNLDEQAPLWLARIKSPKVETFLRRCVQTKDRKTGVRYLHALAVHYGLPESVGWESDLRGCDEAVFTRARGLVLERKPVDAVVFVLESLEENEARVNDVGLVRDPRITRYLERVRSRRHLGLYAWTTSQLALQGDQQAREEFWEGCLLGRYRWVDNSNPRALTLNFDLGTIPFWLSELETNCCRRNSANQVFKHLFGLDLYRDNRFFPEVVQAAEFWERCRNNLRWSRIKGHYVRGPDR